MPFFNLTRAALIAGGVALVVSGGYLWNNQRSSADSAAHADQGEIPGLPDEPSPQSDAAGSQSPGSSAGPRDAMVPLPDHSLPLAYQIPALLQRAEQGEPVASCRLIASLIRCREERRRWELDQTKRHGSAGQSSRAESKYLERPEEPGGYCNGVDTDLLPRPEALFHNAMSGFSPRQKTVLAMTRSDGSILRLNGSTPYFEPGLYVFPQFLADHTVEFLMVGYTAKDPLALEGLVILHSPGNTMIRKGIGVRLPNPRLFLQYSMLMHEVFGAESLGQEALFLMKITQSTMTQEQLDNIRRRVSAEAIEWRRSLTESSQTPAWLLPGAPEHAFRACSD